MQARAHVLSGDAVLNDALQRNQTSAACKCRELRKDASTAIYERNQVASRHLVAPHASGLER